MIMSTISTIEWTERTWNPLCGCSIISPGCHNCYAMKMAARLRGVALNRIATGRNPGRLRHYIDVISDGRWNGTMNFVPESLNDPAKWKPSTVFVNSMSDLFHDNVDIEWMQKICATMALVNRHTYQILTKRAERLHDRLNGCLREFALLSHIWWGVSVENRKHGLPRIEQLRQSPAAVRFLSIEPLLEDLGEIDLRGIDWVIVGGESGSRCRPMEEAWVQSLLRQCKEQGVRFFFKQWGGRSKKKSGRTLNGRTYDDMPLIQINNRIES